MKRKNAKSPKLQVPVRRGNVLVRDQNEASPLPVWKRDTLKQLKKIILQQRRSSIVEKQRLIENFNIDLDITSDDCIESAEIFQQMGPMEKSQHILQLWHQVWRKALASYNVISFFNEIRSRFYLFGLSNNMDQIYDGEMAPPYILMPEDSISLIWSLVNILLLLYTATVMPFKVAFEQQDSTDYVEYFVDVLFTVDIIMTFFTAVQSQDIKDERIIFDLKTIGKRYIKSFFIIDVLACFPFSLVAESSQGGKSYNKLLRLMRLPRFFRIMRVVRIIKNMKALTENKYYRKVEKYITLHRAVIRMAQGVIICVIMTHIMGCMWFLTSQFADFAPETWVHRMNKVDSDGFDQYLQSFYWSSQTVLTIGYGDMPAQTETEMLLASFWMLLGVGFYSFVVGNYTSMITEWIISDARIQVKVKKVKDMSIKLKFPVETAQHLTEFVQKNYKSLTMDSILRQDQAKLFLSLPSNLKKEISTALYSKIVEKVKFFKEMMDRDFLWFLLPQLRQIRYDKDDLIYKRNDPADLIYFICKGAVRMYSQKLYCFTRYEEGDMFGESDTLCKLPRDCHAMSQTHVILYTLKVDYAFLKASKEFTSNLKNMIKQAKTKRVEHTTLMMTVDNPFIMKGNQRRQYKNNATFKSLKTFKETGKIPSHMNLQVAYEESFKTSSISEFSERSQYARHNKSSRIQIKGNQSAKSSSSSSSPQGQDNLLAIPGAGKELKKMISKVSNFKKRKKSSSSSNSLECDSGSSEEERSNKKIFVKKLEDDKSEDSEEEEDKDDKLSGSQSNSSSNSSISDSNKVKIQVKRKTIKVESDSSDSRSQNDDSQDEEGSESDQSNSSGLSSLMQKAREEDQAKHGKEVNSMTGIFEEIQSSKLKGQHDFKKFIDDTLSVVESQRELKQTLGTHGTNQKSESTNQMKTQIEKQLSSHIAKLRNQTKAPNSNMDAARFKMSLNKIVNPFESDIILHQLNNEYPLRLNFDKLKFSKLEPSSKKSSSYLSDRKSSSNQNMRRSFGARDLHSILRSERRFTMIEEEIKQEEESFSDGSQEEIKIEAQIDPDKLLFTERKDTQNENESMLSQHYMFTKSKESAQNSSKQISRKQSGIQRILSRAFSNLQQMLPKKIDTHNQLNEDIQKLSHNQSLDNLLSIDRADKSQILDLFKNSFEKSKFAAGKDNKKQFFPLKYLKNQPEHKYQRDSSLNTSIIQESDSRISPEKFLRQPYFYQGNDIGGIEDQNQNSFFFEESCQIKTERVCMKGIVTQEQDFLLAQINQSGYIPSDFGKDCNHIDSYQIMKDQFQENQQVQTFRQTDIRNCLRENNRNNYQNIAKSGGGVFEYARLLEEQRLDESLSSYTAIVIEQSFDDLSEMEECKRKIAQQQYEYTNYLEDISILDHGLEASIKLQDEIEYQQIQNQAKSPLFFQQNIRKPELIIKERVNEIDLERGYNYSEREIKFKASQSQLQVVPNAAKRISAVTQKVKQVDTNNSVEDRDSLIPRRMKRSKSQSSSTKYKTSDQNPKTSISPSHLNMQGSLKQMKRVSFNVEAKNFDRGGFETPNLETPFAETPIQREKLGLFGNSVFQDQILQQDGSSVDLINLQKFNSTSINEASNNNYINGNLKKARNSQPPLFPQNSKYHPSTQFTKQQLRLKQQLTGARRFMQQVSQSNSRKSSEHDDVVESAREEIPQREESKEHQEMQQNKVKQKDEEKEENNFNQRLKSHKGFIDHILTERQMAYIKQMRKFNKELRKISQTHKKNKKNSHSSSHFKIQNALISDYLQGISSNLEKNKSKIIHNLELGNDIHRVLNQVESDLIAIKRLEQQNNQIEKIRKPDQNFSEEEQSMNPSLFDYGDAQQIEDSYENLFQQSDDELEQ